MSKRSLRKKRTKRKYIKKSMFKRSLRKKVSPFLEDLAYEGSPSIDHFLIRCRREEPLTIGS